MMFLSVIIPTRNRGKYLKGALDSIIKQTYPARLFEVIVVDNGSTDNTKDICAWYTNQIKNLHYVYDETPGLHVGRHLGMKIANSDFLVYADDDIEAFPTWLEGVAEAFQDKEVVLVGGKNLPKFESEPPGWLLAMWDKDKNGDRILGALSILDLGDETKEISPYQVFGCNFSIRKSVLLEAGGFHPDAMPQELIMYRGDGETHVSKYISESGHKTTYHPKSSVYHLVPINRMNEKYFCRRAFNQGISDSYTRIRKNNKYMWHAVFKMRLRKVELKIRNIFFNNRQARFGSSYIDGYLYHQREAKNNRTIFDWIFKDDYLG